MYVCMYVYMYEEDFVLNSLHKTQPINGVLSMILNNIQFCNSKECGLTTYLLQVASGSTYYDPISGSNRFA